ncbi:MAG: M23 family metallopeptidase [Synechococcales cyanobacterium RM1_1_8]|nr:M23 family metallopeptidase [Synechococcales cyanobacterium RM1_1_8]
MNGNGRPSVVLGNGSAAPSNVSAAQAAKIQASGGFGNPGRNGHLPTPSTTPTTQLAGRTGQGNGYSVTYPTSGALSMAVQSLGQTLSPSLSATSYFARTQRPSAVPGNGDRQLLFPLSVPAPISSVFGWRIHPIFNTQRFHSGTDLAAEQGTPVVATLTGLASVADFVGGYGLTVVLDHADGKHQTLYGHMSEIYVQPGQVVRQGEVIGRVGSTGNSTGPHLHFEVRELTNEGWMAIDPGRYLEGSIAQLMNVLRNEPMNPIAISQIPIQLQPSTARQAGLPQNQLKLSTGLKPLLQRSPQAAGFQPRTPLEQKVVQVVKALENSPQPRTAARVQPRSQSTLSYQPANPNLVTQALSPENSARE